MSESFKKTVYRLMKKWGNTYRKELRDKDYPYFYGSYIPPYLEFLDEEERREAIEKAERLLDQQVEFIQRFVIYMMLSGETKETLRRIKQFLSYQHLSAKYFREYNKPEFHMTFWGGKSGIPIVVNVKSLQEFDFADSWLEEVYDIICISNNKWKSWTKMRIEKIIEHIKNDFEYDGYKVEIVLESGYAGQLANQEISIQCIFKD